MQDNQIREMKFSTRSPLPITTTVDFFDIVINAGTCCYCFVVSHLIRAPIKQNVIK